MLEILSSNLFSGSNIAMGVLILVLLMLFVYISTRRWGVNWYTWILGRAGSMKRGFLLIIVFFAIFLLVGYWLGSCNH